MNLFLLENLGLSFQRDDGWQRTGGDDQAFVYSLEEIPGGEYALHCDSSGVTKVSNAPNVVGWGDSKSRS